VTQITEHLADILERVARVSQAAHRSDARVVVVAVSKQQTPAAIREAFAAGQRDFGESYAQEAVAKMRELADLDITWHFIGRAQANKTREIAARFSWVHTVDRAKIAARLSDQRPHFAPPLNVLIQVNQGGESQKSGVAPEQVAELASEIARLPRLKLRGLMTIPPADDQPAVWFERLAVQRAELAAAGFALDTLSMGMSDDFEAAIAAGSNCVRIGSAIFGPRSHEGGG
jgi:PLP dependent protein